jgi:hypothetical protein
VFGQDRSQRFGQRNVVFFAVLDRSETRDAVHDADLAANVDDRARVVQLDVIDRQAEHLGLAHAGTGPEVHEHGVSRVEG